MARKDYFAAYVRTTMPHVGDGDVAISKYYRYESKLAIPYCLDVYCICGIIIETIGKPILGDRGARQKRQQASQGPGPARRGSAESGPEKVQDPKFHDGEFFDVRDIVQVKYEMLRRVSVEKASVASATQEYGVSRPTYYQTKASFQDAGIAGLLPGKRGPRGPHKLQGEVLAFIHEHVVAGQPIRARQMAKLIQKKFDLDVHPRTIERAVAVKKTAH
jgi:transposase